jgi:large subunit ribosomal protein L15
MNKHRVMTRIKYMPKHWGMHGFNRDPSLRNVSVTINVGQLEELANGATELDLSALGIDKLLGTGKVSSALTVTVDSASAKAVEKIEAAGGSVEMDDDDWDEDDA